MFSLVVVPSKVIAFSKTLSKHGKCELTVDWGL